MADLYALTERDVERLRALLNAWDQGRLNKRTDPQPDRLPGPTWTRIAYTTEDIPGYDEDTDTPGVGTADYQWISANDSTFGDYPPPPADKPLSGDVWNITDQGIPEGTRIMTIRDGYSGADVVIPLPSLATGWVRILCIKPGTYGYPGVPMFYDSDTQTYLDNDPDLPAPPPNPTVGVSLAAGVQNITPSSMEGITKGDVLLVIDGLCNSFAITVGAVTPTSFATQLAVGATAYPVLGVVMGSGGSGYTSAPTVAFTGTPGTGAAGTAILGTGALAGTVIGVSITSPGQDYSAGATVGFSGGGGSGATAAATIGPPISLILNGIWVPFTPTGGYIPVANDVAEPIVFEARQEEDSPDGLTVYLSEGGETVEMECPNGQFAVFVAGRLQSYVPGS